MAANQFGGVTYEHAGAEYFEKRQLKRHARIGSLWALGVGAVISGHFSGWNPGVASGGWGDMPKGLMLGIATPITSAMLVTFCNASIGGHAPGQLRGAFSLGTSAEPLLDGFRTLYGTGIAKLLSLFTVVGLVASFHTIIFA